MLWVAPVVVPVIVRALKVLVPLVSNLVANGFQASFLPSCTPGWWPQSTGVMCAIILLSWVLFSLILYRFFFFGGRALTRVLEGQHRLYRKPFCLFLRRSRIWFLGRWIKGYHNVAVLDNNRRVHEARGNTELVGLCTVGKVLRRSKRPASFFVS